MITYFYTAIVGISFIVSLFSFRLRGSYHLKIFSILLGLTFIVEVFTSYLIKSLHVQNDLWVYNIFMLVEFWVYAFYYKQIIKIPTLKKVITIFLLVIPLFWLFTSFFVFKLEDWNSYLNIAGSFFTICLALFYYYQLLTSPYSVNLLTHAEFWIATGMLVFYCCQIPYLGTLNFLYTNYRTLSLQFYDVFISLDILMYLMFTYAFICIIITKKYIKTITTRS